MKKPPAGGLHELEEALGYRFKDRALLVTALTHASFRFEQSEALEDNQRLEFLGDAVLGLLTAEHVYAAHVDEGEGVLTALRSQVASGRALAEVATELRLGEHLRIGRGEERSGGRKRGRLLADALEAVLGAAWLDGGPAAARRVYRRLFEPRLPQTRVAPWADDPKGVLQAHLQRAGKPLPQYLLVSREGPGHAPTFRVRVCAGELQAEGVGNSKREAEVAAARLLLQGIPRDPGAAAASAGVDGDGPGAVSSGRSREDTP